MENARPKTRGKFIFPLRWNSFFIRRSGRVEIDSTLGAKNINIPFLLNGVMLSRFGETARAPSKNSPFSLSVNEIKLRMEEIIMEFVLDGTLKFKGNFPNIHILSVNNRYILNYFQNFTFSHLSLWITFERSGSPFSIYASSRRCVRRRIRSRSQRSAKSPLRKTGNNWSDVEFAVIPQ